MPKRSHLFLAISVAVVLAAIACGGEKAADGAAEPTAAPTEEVQAAPVVAEATQVTVPSPTSEPVSTATVPPTVVSGLNGATPTGGLVAVAAGDELTTVEVVKILTPSVVQIATEAVGMGMFNQPVPSQGVGTGQGSNPLSPY